jgi:hypothetical protein
VGQALGHFSEELLDEVDQIRAATSEKAERATRRSRITSVIQK